MFPGVGTPLIAPSDLAASESLKRLITSWVFPAVVPLRAISTRSMDITSPISTMACGIKTPRFQRFRMMSRACLGKLIVLISKVAPKRRA